MKHRAHRLIGGLLAVALVVGGTTPARAADVEIPDAALAACVQRNLTRAGLSTELTDENLAALSSLVCAAETDGVVTNLTGLDHLTSLQSLRLTGHAVTDLNPIGSLPQLLVLYLTLPPTAEPAVLERLTLTALWLEATGTALPALPGLTATDLVLTGQRLQSLAGLGQVIVDTVFVQNSPVISDVSALAGSSARRSVLRLGPNGSLAGVGEITGLEHLDVTAPGLTDVAALAGHPTLQHLQLAGERLADLSGLATVPTLRELSVSGSQVTNLGPSGGLKGLTSISVRGAKVRSLEALRGATALVDADLSYNELSDVSPLAGLPSGATVDLTANRIADFSALKGWTGTLRALSQVVDLPDATAGVPYLLPFSLRGADGRALLPNGYNNAVEAGGYLTYPDRTPAGPQSTSFWDVLDADRATISVALHQTLIARNFVAPAPVFTASPRVGVPFTAKYPAWSPAPERCSYQWFDTNRAIAGATGKTYTPTAASEGWSLLVKVTCTKRGYLTIDVLSQHSQAVSSGSLAFGGTVTPAIQGTRAVGRKLTASVDWAPKASLSYQWYRNGKAIKKATGRSYTLAVADLGTKITVKVTGRKAGYATLTKTSAATKKIAKGTLASHSVRISGTAKAGKTLTVVRGTWGPGAVSFTYQWYRDGKALTKATRKSYKVAFADAGHTLAVKVTGKKPGFASASQRAKGVAVASPGRS